MRTVPLRGKKAAGRVALVDDEDYEFVMQYKWRVYEHAGTATTRTSGPYAVTTIREGDRKRTVGMHRLLTGWPLTDHANRDGLDNQRSNLRAATKRQNGQNRLGRLVATSRFKGVEWSRRQGQWQARICVNGKYRHLGFSDSEIEMAHAYDEAALKYFGEFARTNFPEGPTQAMREQWQADRAARTAIGAENARRATLAARAKWWAQREYEARVCTACGDEYQSRSAAASLYCSSKCGQVAGRRRRRERELEGRLF